MNRLSRGLRFSAADVVKNSSRKAANVLSQRFSQIRVALVHDWLTGMRGGERVLEAICHLFPHADLFTLIHLPGRVSPRIERMAIRTSVLGRIPGAARHFRLLLPVFPYIIGRFDLSGYDLIVSISHAVAKGATYDARPLHVCYLLAPMRYMWAGYDDYFAPERASPVLRAAARVLRPFLQRWDRRTAQRVHRFFAVSRYVQEQARRYYGRSATVVYPPVDLARFSPLGPKQNYYLLAGALTPNKRPGQAVAAFARLGLPLKVAGSGPEEKRCRRLAGTNVAFLGEVSDAAMATLYRGAKALIFPGCDDFGLVPVEAQASGTPVIALAAGGALESVTPATGLLYTDPTVEGLAAAVELFEESPHRFDPDACVANAARFGAERFKRELLAQIGRAWRESGRPCPIP